ncbi:unnamed protein product [Chondrus crispus]|uniref:Uncharacterized protein n=1 Tax=Chondrus crispus TaxID=2769 RepID=R7QA18_CHOCR|nr:unnamed protein product [Chondrus crispus]CDF34256.1 unnamed protein product [Chondrus crispus]|eukprot:XP_005714075.1 unnamed protein product [Chondrus crispus]
MKRFIRGKPTSINSASLSVTHFLLGISSTTVETSIICISLLAPQNKGNWKT